MNDTRQILDTCPLCSKAIIRDVRQLMDSQVLCFCERCRKYFIRDIAEFRDTKHRRVEITIKLSGERASGKTRLIACLAKLFEKCGAEIDLDGVPDISGHGGYKPNLQRSLENHNADPIRFEKMKIKFIEVPPKDTFASMDTALANLKLFGKI